MAIDKAALDLVIDHLKAGGTVDSFLRKHGVEPREHTDLTTCYRCWQIGDSSKATCMVVYNEGTSHEWTSPSCESCLSKDGSTMPGKTRYLSPLQEKA